MELFFCKVVHQDAQCSERSFVNQNNETKIIKSLNVEISNGLDVIIAEANDALAEQLQKQPLDTTSRYNVSLQFRTNAKKDDTSRRFNSVKLVRIIPV